jgi:hypothetical protein
MYQILLVHYLQLPVEVEEQEVANNTNQEEGALELQPGPKSSDLQDFFDLGQESEEDEADEGTLGEEVDAIANPFY